MEAEVGNATIHNGFPRFTTVHNSSHHAHKANLIFSLIGDVNRCDTVVKRCELVVNS